jgi:hypothetical protein
MEMNRSWLRKLADREWEMAGLARQDNDRAAEIKHTGKAREYERMLGELVRSGA